MRDRLSTFSDPKIIKLLQETFIPATGNDWYNRRRKDAAGEFFRSVAEQGPRRGGDGTKQGHYILTASGKLLGYNNNRDLAKRHAFIDAALAQWRSLPAAEKAPDAVKVPPLASIQTDARLHADAPAGGVVLVASERLLKPAGNTFAACTADDHEHGWGHLAAVDRLWIQKSEWQALLATGSKGGDLPAALAHRIARFHLLDFTRGEPPFWSRDEIQSLSINIAPADAPHHFRIQGEATLSSADDTRGFQVELLGKIETRPDGTPTKFDLIALGDHWGEGRFTGGARPGRNPLGIAFRLADPKKAADLIRPQGSHWLQGYYEADQH